MSSKNSRSDENETLAVLELATLVLLLATLAGNWFYAISKSEDPSLIFQTAKSHATIHLILRK